MPLFSLLSRGKQSPWDGVDAHPRRKKRREMIVGCPPERTPRVRGVPRLTRRRWARFYSTAVEKYAPRVQRHRIALFFFPSSYLMDLRAMKSKAHEKISRKNRPSSGIFFLAGSGTKMPYGYSVRRKCRKCGPQSAALSFPAVGGEPVRRSLWRNSPSSEYENRRVGNDGSKTVARALKSESQRRPRDGAGFERAAEVHRIGPIKYRPDGSKGIGNTYWRACAVPRTEPRATRTRSVRVMRPRGRCDRLVVRGPSARRARAESSRRARLRPDRPVLGTNTIPFEPSGHRR